MPGAVSFYRKKATLRIYSKATTTTGGATGPKYLEVRFQNGNISFPLGPAFPEQTLILDRNTFTSDAHWIDVDDTSIFNPLPLSYEFRAVDEYMRNLLQAHCKPLATTAWVVGNYIWTGYASTDFTRRDGNDVAVTIPTFAFTGIRMVRVELRMEATSTEAPNTYEVFKFTGVNFPRDQVSGALADDGLIFTANGVIHGDVSLATAFSTGAQTDT